MMIFAVGKVSEALPILALTHIAGRQHVGCPPRRQRVFKKPDDNPLMGERDTMSLSLRVTVSPAAPEETSRGLSALLRRHGGEKKMQKLIL